MGIVALKELLVSEQQKKQVKEAITSQLPWVRSTFIQPMCVKKDLYFFYNH